MDNRRQLPEWAIGPFGKYPSNPILSPTGEGWEGWTTYNPAVIVKDGRFHMAYRAEPVDRLTPYMGTSQIGLATSDDGYRFERHPGGPIIAATEEYELPGGCEDPRLVRHGDTYYMTYTAYRWPSPVYLCLASSTDLLQWRKLGPLFPDLPDTKSGCIVQDPQGNAVRIDGRYVMYMNEHIACSRDFSKWEVRELRRRTSGEACVAITDYSRPGTDDIILFYAGSLHGEVREIQWHYAISESLYSRKDPERLIDVLDRPILKPETAAEKDPDRLGEDGAKGVVFLNSILRHEGTWWMHYGASDRFVCVATCPA